MMRQVQFFDQVDNAHISIISSDNQQHLYIEHELADGSRMRDPASGNYQNARMLSEALRDAIGYGPARDLLRKYDVAEDDPLMYLGVHN